MIVVGFWQIKKSKQKLDSQVKRGVLNCRMNSLTDIRVYQEESGQR